MKFLESHGIANKALQLVVEVGILESLISFNSPSGTIYIGEQSDTMQV
jgi:hypothetical protein